MSFYISTEPLTFTSHADEDHANHEAHARSAHCCPNGRASAGGDDAIDIAAITGFEAAICSFIQAILDVGWRIMFLQHPSQQCLPCDLFSVTVSSRDLVPNKSLHRAGNCKFHAAKTWEYPFGVKVRAKHCNLISLIESMKTILLDQNVTRLLRICFFVSAGLLSWQLFAYLTGTIPVHILPVVILISGSEESIPLAYSWSAKLALLSIMGVVIPATILVVQRLIQESRTCSK